VRGEPASVGYQAECEREFPHGPGARVGREHRGAANDEATIADAVATSIPAEVCSHNSRAT
jgi:hypothetical protein